VEGKVEEGKGGEGRKGKNPKLIKKPGYDLGA